MGLKNETFVLHFQSKMTIGISSPFISNQTTANPYYIDTLALTAAIFVALRYRSMTSSADWLKSEIRNIPLILLTRVSCLFGWQGYLAKHYKNTLPLLWWYTNHCTLCTILYKLHIIGKRWASILFQLIYIIQKMQLRRLSTRRADIFDWLWRNLIKYKKES